MAKHDVQKSREIIARRAIIRKQEQELARIDAEYQEEVSNQNRKIEDDFGCRREQVLSP